MKNIIKNYFGNKRGMSLVEVLTAMAILSLIIFCFTPLFLQYFKSITIAGDELSDVQEQSGILQTVIGNFDAGKGGNYSANVTTIPLQLTTASSATLSRTDGETTVTTNMTGAATVIMGTQSNAPNGAGVIDDITGDFLVSDPNNMLNGYATISAQGTSSGLVCYPKTLTDDFVTAKIIVYGSGGITFAKETYMNDIKLSCGEKGVIKLTNNKDYTIRYVTSSIVEITVYGGGLVSFETSPLLVDYNNGQHTLPIEVDAPSMIMVGEAADDGKYYYYVSRGEFIDGLDEGYIDDSEENELVIIRREMNSTDPNTTGKVTLNAPMNDVEWVPAESADNHVGSDKNNDGKITADEKYGYYVMCGDNGQVRRFWRNDTTGNYYWGGDYTYYTDYNFVHVNNQTGQSPHINATKKDGTADPNQVYSTDTSFKFISQRDMTNTQSGFNVGSKEYTFAGFANTSTILLRSLSVVSVTRSDYAEFYGSDGRIITYALEKKESSKYPTYTEGVAMSGSWDGITVGDKPNLISIENDNQTYGWFKTNTDSYYEINGIDPATVNKNSYPITLTSVDAIRISGDGAAHKTDVKASSEGSYYFTTSGDGDTSAEGATTNMNYPQSSYNLYCGYIPAFMDLFAAKTGTFGSYRYPTSWEKTFGFKEGGTFYEVNGPILQRAENRPTLENNAQYYAYWRMTLGITPYYNDGSTTVKISPDRGQLAYKHNYKEGGFIGIGSTQMYLYSVYWPYTNLEYAITGKFYDNDTYTNNPGLVQNHFGFGKTRASAFTVGSPRHLINNYQGVQSNVTNGEVVDITIAYLSHPFAIAVAANPTDDIVYDLANNKSGTQVFYWNNRRETITFLDSASTVIPNGENDIPVSLMVGYVMGGTVEYSSDGGDSYANVGSVMNNGIVFLRAGNYNVGKQNSANSQTYEYLATDSDGYKLAAESNVFHQFYYLNSRTTKGYNGENYQDPSKGKHIGNLYGAEYWQNNRHIQYKSITGGTATDGHDTSTNYEYLRSHPMTNTKVTCVAWGTTWNGHPEAMWGTENGTVLSWYVELQTAKNASDSSAWNDRSVDAEFQSYKWVDNVDNKTFALDSSQWKDTVGSATFDTQSTTGKKFSKGDPNFKYFYDKESQNTANTHWSYSNAGFISTLETINDIAYSNDYWVAVGNQSDKDPATYCPAGTSKAKPYSDNGMGGSWVNVRYWVDATGSGKQEDSNAFYHWRAVKISSNENYNIVQINNLNGIWIASGYLDANNNEIYDNGERTVICWTRNPLRSCNENGGWCERVQFIEKNATTAGYTNLTRDTIGGINSCATRVDD